MPTNFPELFAALAAPFAPEEVKSRPGGNGRHLYYVTASTVANRLDEVLGPEAWDFELAPWGEGALIGTLVVRLPDGSVLRKSNVGGRADMAAGDDDAKSAASDCLKRCATLLGVARYLYQDGVPRFVRAARVATATPAATVEPVAEPEPTTTRPTVKPAPRDASSLYRWLKDMEKSTGLELIKPLAGWAKLERFPVRILGWDSDQVVIGYHEAIRLIEMSSTPAPSTNGNGNGKH